MFYIKTAACYTGEERLDGALIGVEAGKIASVGRCDSRSDFSGAESAQTAPAQTAGVIDLTGLTVLPGFIDIHTHGGNGFDIMQGTYEAVNGLSLHKLAGGVTSFCPTTATDTPARTRDAVSSVREARARGADGARVIGAFVEGPYISREYRGAHAEALLRPDFTVKEISEMLGFGGGAITSVAIAPELPNALETIKMLRQAGVSVRLGHTAATYDQAMAGIAAGGSAAIHTYNAMSPLNHREPGMVGAVLSEPGIYAELICDFIHVHPAAIKILLAAKGPDKVILITDSMAAAGLGDGEYGLGSEKVTVKGGVARTQEGALAGSTLTIIRAVKNICQTLGAPLGDAVRMASVNPAKALGMYDMTGSIAAGKNADIIGIDGEFNVRFAMVGGEVKIGNNL